MTPVCRNGTAWESLASVAAAGATVADGLSGSLVFRDQSGGLHGHPTISVSATTGSMGIGAGSSAWYGNNALYVSGNIATPAFMYAARYSSYDNGSIESLRVGSGALSFYTSNTEAMRIVNTGFVGIGTNSPVYMLDVSGSIRTKQLFQANTGVRQAALDGTGLYSQAWGYGFALSTRRSVTGIENINQLFLDPIGYVGIGTSLPSTTLHVSGTGAFTGNVGVGTTAPNSALDVNGTVSATNVKAAGTVTYGAYSSEPVACSAAYKGMVAMSNTLENLCLCTGTRWVGVGTGGTACTW